jgi:hypothetical protein
MKIIEVPTKAITSPGWNCNQMDPAMRCRLRCSIERFGMVVPLVVRSIGDGRYETIGGALRLAILGEMGVPTVTCVKVEADDAHALLLSQTLNHIAGQDNLGLRAELLRRVLEVIPQGEVLCLLPETTKSLTAIASLSQENIAEHLKRWEQAQVARLKHFNVQLTPRQLSVVIQAIALVQPDGEPDDPKNPNRRGNALYRLCLEYLELRSAYTRSIRRKGIHEQSHLSSL